MNIVCGKCGKDSGVEKTGKDGIDAAHVQHRSGFLVKLPTLVGIHEWFFACSKECMRTLLDETYEKNGVTAEMLAESKAITDGWKAKIPAQAQEIGEKMEKLKKLLMKK